MHIKYFNFTHFAPQQFPPYTPNIPFSFSWPPPLFVSYNLLSPLVLPICAWLWGSPAAWETQLMEGMLATSDLPWPFVVSECKPKESAFRSDFIE